MTFDQTMLLIFSQICIQTNLEFDIIKKPQSVQQYLYYIPMLSILASTTLRISQTVYVYTIGTHDLKLFGSHADFQYYIEEPTFAILERNYLDP